MRNSWLAGVVVKSLSVSVLLFFFLEIIKIQSLCKENGKTHNQVNYKQISKKHREVQEFYW